MQNKAASSGPLALLAKLAAVAVAIGGILLVRHPESADRVVVVLAPGLAEDRIQAAIASGRAPHLALLASTGLLTGVDTPVATAPAPAISGLTFWRRTLADSEPDPSGVVGVGVGGDIEPLWSEFGARAAALGTSDMLFPGLERHGGAGAGTAAAAFVGSSGMVPVDARDLLATRLPPPYEALGDSVRAAAANLPQGHWTDWIESSGDGGARLQVLRASPDQYLLSPLYRSTQVATTPPSDVIAGEPFIGELADGLRTAFVDHLLSIDATRAVAAQRLLQSGDEVRSVFYVFPVGASAARLFGKDKPDSTTYDHVIDALDQRLASLSSALGEQGLLLVVGGPGLGREAAGPAWCLVSSGVGLRLEGVHLDVPGLARLLRYLLGMPLEAKQREALAPSVLTRFPRRASARVQAPPAKPSGPTSPWSAEALQALLHLPGS